MSDLKIKFATSDDVTIILQFIKELAQYEKLSHLVVATEDLLKEKLFGQRKYAEVILGCVNNQPIGFALFFHNFSTFLAKAGIYLEDLYITPVMRGQGYAKQMLSFLANLAIQRDCGRLDWSVLDWNKPAIDFYKSIGAKAMDDWVTYRVTGNTLNELASLIKDGVYESC